LLGESVLEFGEQAALDIHSNLISGMAEEYEDLFEDLCSFVCAFLSLLSYLLTLLIF
jgi:hypothetical protein